VRAAEPVLPLRKMDVKVWIIPTRETSLRIAFAVVGVRENDVAFLSLRSGICPSTRKGMCVPTAVPDLPILNAIFRLNELRNEHMSDRVRPPLSL
jgi:hypothetical protein